VFSLVIVVVLGNKVPNFPVYLFSGLVAWNLFSTSLSLGARSVVDNAGLVTKVYFPRELLPLASVGTAGVDFVLQGGVLVLFMLALPVFTFLGAPLASLYSRRHEFEADAYAAAHASGAALVAALVKLYEDNANTLTPDPLHSLFYDSHPPAAARIARLEASGA